MKTITQQPTAASPKSKVQSPTRSPAPLNSGAAHAADDTADMVETFLARGHAAKQAVNEALARVYHNGGAS